MSNNPFDDEHSAPSRGTVMARSRVRSSGRSVSSSRNATGTNSSSSNSGGKEPAIWAARNVEWPLPATISLAHYQKLLQKQGMVEDGAGAWSRLFGSSSSSAASATSSTVANSMESGSRSLKTPRCVATANGWIVAALECSPAAAGSTDGGPRLVSRWNVRRATNDHTILCVPPTTKSSSSSSSSNGDSSRIAGIFCDPTGCHTVLSARNGELYYLHSSSKTIVALPGFDGTATVSGVAASAATKGDTVLQSGLTSGTYVTAIAWDRQRGTEGSTKTILLGTNRGDIFEYALDATNITDATTASNIEHPTLLHRVVAAPITGLYFDRQQSGGLAILVATTGNHTTRLYSFFSPDTSFRTAFASPQLMELPGGGASGSITAELHVDPGDNSSFGLLTATGMYYGTLQGDKIVKAGMLSYNAEENNTDNHKVPLSMALTPHHVIFLHDTQVVFYNRTSLTIIQKERVSGTEDGQLLMDIRRPDQVWLRKGRSLIHISSTMEDRDVWKFTLQKCLLPEPNNGDKARALSQKETLFEEAKSLCTNSVQKAIVTYIRAEFHLAKNRPALAAKYWAQCPPQLAPFSDTALRLVNSDNTSNGSSSPLIAYLSDKMRGAKLADDKVLSTMLGAWLTELHLYDREHNNSSGINANGSSNLQAFLANHVSQLDANTILRILSSHDVSAAECADYAAASGDLGTAVQTALGKRAPSHNSNNAHDALRILNDAPLQMAEPYYYRYASVLLARAPLAASKSFLSRYSQGLSPTKLLPSIMDYERRRRDFVTSMELTTGSPDEGPAAVLTEDPDDPLERSLRVSAVDGGPTKSFNESSGNVVGGGVEVHLENRHGSFVDDETASIKYLEGVIKLGCKSSAIYSYLISLYVAMDDEEPLIRFLKTHVPAAATAAQVTKKAILLTSSGTENLHQFDDGGLSSSPLDMSYALRTILSTGRHFRSAIRLYMGFGLRQQAVELALKVDPTLARELAHEATEADERKRLWLMIARNAAGDRVGGKDVVSKVVSVLKDCGPDVLSIEDVLPFLPDFAQIDQIKDEICDALTSYSSKIEGFLKEMNECDQTCDALRDEISRLSTYQMKMKADAKCALTGQTVLQAGEPFYVFPSGYVFCESALTKEVLPYLNEKQAARVEDVRKTMLHIPEKRRGTSEYDALQAELDGLIAAECPLTGSIMVESIDKGFPESMEMDEKIQMRDNLDQHGGVVEMSSSSASRTDGQSYVSIQPSRSM